MKISDFRFQIVAIVCAIVLLPACATRPKKYDAPSAAKMNASFQRLDSAVGKAHGSAKQARAQVAEAVTLSGPITEKLAQLKLAVPAALSPAVIDIQNLFETQQIQLNDATGTQSRLEVELSDAERAKSEFLKDKAQYISDAGKLAEEASALNAKVVKDEKALSWYRWHWWGAWIATGLGIIVFILFAVLKFTGRLAIKSMIP